jgi:hypothetical protein
MEVQALWALVILAFVLWAGLSGRRRRRGSTRAFSAGPGAIGSVYDLLNEDRRKAIEMIVEQKAASRDPEDADGNLPDLENPTRLS